MVPIMVLPAVGKWEHKGTTAAGTTTGTTGDGPTTVVEDDATVPQVVCRLGGTLVEHPENHLQKVLTWPSSSSSPPPRPNMLRWYTLG
jgi:hypothetical protein